MNTRSFEPIFALIMGAYFCGLGGYKLWKYRRSWPAKHLARAKELGSKKRGKGASTGIMWLTVGLVWLALAIFVLTHQA